MSNISFLVSLLFGYFNPFKFLIFINLVLISYVDICNTINAVEHILNCIKEFLVIVLFGSNFSGSAVGQLLLVFFSKIEDSFQC